MKSELKLNNRFNLDSSIHSGNLENVNHIIRASCVIRSQINAICIFQPGELGYLSNRTIFSWSKSAHHILGVPRLVLSNNGFTVKVTCTKVHCQWQTAPVLKPGVNPQAETAPPVSHTASQSWPGPTRLALEGNLKQNVSVPLCRGTTDIFLLWWIQILKDVWTSRTMQNLHSWGIYAYSYKCFI